MGKGDVKDDAWVSGLDDQVVVVIVSSLSQLSQPPELYVAHQLPLFMGFPRQEYWSGLPFFRGPSQPGIEPRSLELQVVSCTAGGFSTN